MGVTVHYSSIDISHQVLITRVPATSSPIDRAKVLEEKINAAYPGRSVHLIGLLHCLQGCKSTDMNEQGPAVRRS